MNNKKNNQLEVNEHFIKLVGKACIPEPLELGNNFKVEIDGEVTTVTDTNNQNGTKDRYYKFVPILAKILKDNGEVIVAKDNRSASKKVRNMCYRIWESNDDKRDYETAYQDTIKQVMFELVELYDRAKK